MNNMELCHVVKILAIIIIAYLLLNKTNVENFTGNGALVQLYAKDYQDLYMNDYVSWHPNYWNSSRRYPPYYSYPVYQPYYGYGYNGYNGYNRYRRPGYYNYIPSYWN